MTPSRSADLQSFVFGTGFAHERLSLFETIYCQL